MLMKSLSRSILSLSIFFLSVGCNLLMAENTIRLSSKDQLLLIGNNISFFEDVEGNLTLQDILAPQNQMRFIDHDREVFSRPDTKSAFWFKISVQNSSSEDAWLELGSNYAWYIDFYAPDSTGMYSSPIETGTMRPDENKLYDVNFFWLPLNKAGEIQTKTCYFRVESGLTFELPLHVGTIRSLSHNKAINDYLTAGFIGIVLIMLLYNLFIYVSTKDHIYLYYLGYLFMMAISMPYANGYAFIEKVNFLFINKEILNNYFLVWHAPAYFFAGVFCIRYLDLKNSSPIFRRIIQGEIILISVAFPLLNISGFQFVELVNAVQVSILTFYMTCLIAAYYLVFRGSKQATFYALGWTFLVLGTFVFFAVINGFLPFNPITRNTLYFGVAIEVSLFSLALANRLNELRKEKEAIKAENLNLIKDQNENLEREVKKRTAELEATNEELTQSNEELTLTTEQLDAQTRKLLEVNKTKDRLFAIISHDLRSPINSMKGMLNLMYGEDITREEFLKFSKEAKHSVEHAHFMLNNLLNWARFQMQGMTTTPESIDLNPIVSENIALFSETSKKKSIMVVNEITSESRVFADPNHINLVIRNLLSNALKFTECGGKVTFRASNIQGQCEISIADSGVGIAKDKLQDLFDIKPDKGQVGTEGEKGTGLGLPLCKDFIEKNNGEINVESMPGKGTTFFVKLPIGKN
jgi:signal transduction histidine kinase